MSGTDFRSAVEELHRYLSDQVPPLIVAATVEYLLQESPELVAESLHQWAVTQAPRVSGWTSADLLLHSLKKLFMLGELQLIDKQVLSEQLEEVTAVVLGRCGTEDRLRLEELLPRLHQQLTLDLSSGSDSTFAPSRTLEAGPPPGTSAELESGLRRFSLLLSRLQTATGQGGRDQVLSQIAAAAAEQSGDDAELAGLLDRLRRQGITDAGPHQLLRALSRNLPEWTLADQEGAPESAAAGAMRRLLDLEAGHAGGFARVKEMIDLGIEHFNEGALARAVTIFELVERTVAEKHLDQDRVGIVRTSAHERLDFDRLRDLAKNPDSYSLLRKVLRFFPALHPDALLEEMENPDRARRHLFLALLRVHGDAARRATAQHLERWMADLGTEAGWFTPRNLVHLLRTIPGEPADDEIELVVRLSELPRAPQLVRESLDYLGGVLHPRSEDALVARLGEVEKHLAHPEGAPHSLEELARFHSQLIRCLLQIGTSRSRQMAAQSALEQKVNRQENIGRLAALGAVDLSEDRPLVERLIKQLQKELPTRVLGFYLKQDRQIAVDLVQALSGTPLPEVRSLLREIAEGYPDEPFAAAAQEGLARLDAVAEGAPVPTPVEPPHERRSFSGDLELFGLPNLMQNVAQSELSGRLVLTDKAGEVRAQLTFSKGLLTTCRSEHLEGEDAFHQIFEAPFPGAFDFFSAPEEEPSQPDVESWSVMGLLMEAMRRYDELQRARAVVADDAALSATGSRPTPREEETDGVFIREVWQRVKAGFTPARIETEVAADSYRIRALLAHWLEEGAVQISAAGPPSGA